MESVFSSPGEAALKREAGAAGALTPSEELDEAYELERVSGFVRDNRCERVALQFPDELLGDAGAVAAKLEDLTGAKMFILGDTPYGSCCVDAVGAEQAGAQALVHFGPACLSTPARPPPAAFVFGRRPVDLDHCAAAFREAHVDPWAPVVLLSEPACAHALEPLASRLRAAYPEVVVSRPALPLPPGAAAPEELERLGRRFPLPSGRRLEEYGGFYVGGGADGDGGPDLTRLLLGWSPDRPFSSCHPSTGRARDEGPRAARARARRRHLVERARAARTVGLLVGTLGVAGHREALAHLKALARAAGKQTYTLALGRPNPAKLANFPEVDVFVLLACPLGPLRPPPPGGFYRPLVTAYELEAACNPARDLADPYLTHFGELLPDSPFHVPPPPEDSDQWEVPDVSLITGEPRPTPARAPPPPPGPGSGAVTPRAQLPLVESSAAASFLSTRSWRGLEPQLGQTPATGAVAGRRGIAVAYEDEANG
ncbi:2-(3-amino-3-carboxypropyl)histidine synthase subunit 2 [Ornithorhynchus anatinus]|uniref:2-(3-amino-3-carboxypropyl)histidine synthase subunit 2 n=1 Tax=Ornithorhynchus anatinus TaxID=9258 RepID=A0A6I8PT02_ORNAN|nr:2-(3-amino-3-carboxypropyl)histidine synthase subunit 2 [Ornithorhynchus anatinus]